MKKIKIAIGVIVVVGIAWTGSAWFTGKKLEENREQAVQGISNWINTQIPEEQLSLKITDYQRGVFSSHATLLLQPGSNGGELLKPGQTISFKATIDHGPFPFAKLKKINFIPAMASIGTELQNTDLVKTLFTLTKGKPFFTSETSISYAGNSRTDVNFIPVDAHELQQSFDLSFSGGRFTFVWNSHEKRLDYNGTTDSLLLSTKASGSTLLGPIQFALDGLRFQGSSSPGLGEIPFINQEITLKDTTTSMGNTKILVLDRMRVATKVAEDGGKIAASFAYSIDSINIRGQDLGTVNFDLGISQIDPTLLKSSFESYLRDRQQLLADTRIDDPTSDEKMLQILGNNMLLVLKDEPVLTTAALKWKNDKGESIFNLSAHLKDSQAGQAGQKGVAAIKFQDLVQLLTMKLKISLDMVKEAITRFNMSDGKSQDEATRLAETLLPRFTSMEEISKLTVQQDNSILSELHYSNGEVTLNNKKMPLDQFINDFIFGKTTSQPPSN